MKKKYFCLVILFFGFTCLSFSQTISERVIHSFNPSTVRNVYEIIRMVPLNEDKQLLLSKAIEEEDKLFAEYLKAEKVLSISTTIMLANIRKANLSKILSESELDQYYRGISDTQAEVMAAEMRDTKKKEYGLSYQEGKFVYASFYKIFIESAVAKLKYADKPKKLESILKQIRKDELLTLSEKSGLSFDENNIITKVWTFRPGTPLR